MLTTTISNTSLTMMNTQATPVFSPTLWINLIGGSAGDSPNDSGKEAGLAGGHAGGDDFTADNATFAGTVSQASQEGGVITVTERGGDGGAAGTGDRSSATPVYGGTGGGAAAVTFTFTDTTVTANGNDLSALYATVQGGNGGNGGAGNHEEDWSFGGAGGPTGVLSVTLPDNSTNSFTTVGDSARGIYLLSAAGDGGMGAETGGLFQDGVSAGDGGNGADTNTLTIDNEGALTITTRGARSAAIEVETSGGAGGDGGQLDGGDFSGSAGKGGNGGSGELVTVTLNGSGILTAQGTLSPAIYARSLGGDAGDGGPGNRSSVNPDGGYGGNGGSTGGVIVTLGAGMYINTLSEESPGIVALSRAGFGGRGGNGGTGDDGEPAGSGGNAGGIQVTIDGHVTTEANYSPTVLLQAISGSGGAGGDASAYFTGTPGGPGDPGTVGDIVVTLTGSVQTLGVYSDGIVAQSLGGGGGAGGSSSAFFYAPGAGAANGTDGGTVTVTSTGSIATSYENSSGIVAQSIGGGGGIGGAGSAVVAATGGKGGNGGDGGKVTLTLGGLIQTGGPLSKGAVAQSIGGVGGSGGNAYSANAGATVAIGGSGGSGGDGGAAEIDPTNLALWTTGDGGIGLLGQSIGGGGGAGGAAYAESASAFVSYATAIGGQGGNGGNGTSVTETLTNTSIVTGEGKNGIVTSSIDAHGVVAQSVGGGGGAGGGASAEAFAKSLKLGETADGNGKVWWKTDSLPSQSAALQIGGRNGTSGNGGSVTITLKSGTTVTTYGDGSVGVIAQSIGAGGGSGGDTSLLRGFLAQLGDQALSAPLPTSKIDVDTTVGSYHDTASTGAQAVVTLGDGTGGAASDTVTTSGDYATGILVQSIGGGGGLAGIGSSQVYNVSSSLQLTLETNVGAQGGGGGDGGQASATIDTDGAITTNGAGAAGVLIQSIGGGGGVASGGNVLLGGNDSGSSLFGGLTTGGGSTTSLTTTLTWAEVLGTVAYEGGSSFSAATGSGGTAEALLTGSVTTTGDDSPAVLMQSIGGGGGVLGSSSAGANDDTVAASSSSSDPTLTVRINHHIGAGGQIRLADKIRTGIDGEAVTIDTLSGTLTTSGNNAPAVQMQSIGAGGGRAGTAITLKNTEAAGFANVTFENAGIGDSPQGDDNRLTLGASSGLTGNGGTVQATVQNATIRTGAGNGSAASTGYQAFGLLMQSIGGGGGSMTDGSNIITNETLAVGGGTDFNYGQGLSEPVQIIGDGGTVSLFGSSDNETSTVRTAGDGADGVVLQSIGGGGGVANNVQPDAWGADSAVTNIILGGYNAVGSGKAVTIGAVDGGKTQLSVMTTGNRAYGIVAQSIGGGGGLVNYGTKNVFLTQIGQSKPASDNGSDDLGGTVSLNLAAGSTILTTGTASFGVVAQSVGGGGGIITTTYDHGATPGFSNATPLSWNAALPLGSSGYGNGGDITINSDADVIVSGAGSIGIVGQSIGGGGGIVDTGSTVFFTARGLSADASSGAVTMNLTHRILARGENSIGVLAQGMGSNASQDHPITITLGDDANGSFGTVIGGSGDGVGVLVYGGSQTNQLTVSSNSAISALSGTAIRQSGNGLLSVVNNGTITGTIDLNGGTVTGTGTTSAAVVAGPLSVVTAAPSSGLLVNNGTLVAPAGQTSVIDGTLEQTASGRIVTTADFASGTSSSYTVTGDAVLAGTLVPTLRSVVAGVRVPVLTVEGTRTGSLSVPDSALFSFGLVRAGETDELEVADTHFSAPTFGLTGEQAALAGGLTDLFDAGDTRLGSFFADLDGVAEASTAAYRAQLSQLAPRAALRMEAQLAEQATAVADDAMTCPSRSPAGGAADFLTEGSCIFARGGAQRTSIGAEGARASSDLTSAGYEIGGQQLIHPGLTVGAVAGYQQSWFGARDGSKDGGTGGQAAVTVKYQPGPWLFTGAIFGSVGDYHVQRMVNVTDFAGITHGRFTQGAIGGRVRAAYTLGTERLYLRPYLNVDGVYAARGAYQETGLRALGLTFGHADQATAIITPAVEVGGRVRLAPRTALRAFGSLGASVRTNDSWGADARLVGFERASRRFTTTLPQDRALARVSAGFQLFQGAGVDVRVQYDGAYGGVSQSSGGSARLVYSF